VNATAVCLAGVLAVGGAGALASRNPEVIRKWRTWLVSAPLVAGLLWLGAPGAALLAAGLGVVGAVEYGRLTRLRRAGVTVRFGAPVFVGPAGAPASVGPAGALDDATPEARKRVVALVTGSH
jgi:hypothetical protein